MSTKYTVTGMSCNGCRSKVENTLNHIEGVTARVTLNPPEAHLEMPPGTTKETLQNALSKAGDYTLSDDSEPGSCCGAKPQKRIAQPVPANAVYYCPMHCEGDKTYDNPADCPVCGMDLVPMATNSASIYACPMQCEGDTTYDTPGDCPVCGMDLVAVGAAEPEDKTYETLKRKMWIAALCTFPVFLIAMTGMWADNPMYRLMGHTGWNIVQFTLSVPVLFYAGGFLFARAWRSIKSGNLNMFTLIGIGTGVAFAFSVVALFLPNIFPDEFRTATGDIHLYFEAATVIITLVLLGQLMEARAHKQTGGAIRNLMQLSPAEAVLIAHGTEKTIPVSQIHKGDLLRIKPGGKIPVDGSVVEGRSDVDESMLTGEPVPVMKSMSDALRAGTVNGNGSMVMRAEKVGSETLLAQIIDMVNKASRSRAPIQQLADKISRYFVPAVLVIAVLTFVIWAVWGPSPAYVYALINAVAVLIIACPCALGLATPMSVMVGVGKAAAAGILVKDAGALQQMQKVNVVLTDKTGTLTEGKPSVSDFEIFEGDPDSVLARVGALQAQSQHPLSLGITAFARAQSTRNVAVSDFENHSGMGISGRAESEKIIVGNKALFDHLGMAVPDRIAEKASSARAEAKTVSFIGIGANVVGFIALQDAVKPSSARAVKDLQDRGIDVVMVTGDNEVTAQAVAKSLGLTQFIANCMPEDKMREIERLQSEGKTVAMAGDGINDAPALAKADVGIAMGTGTDIAMESSDITLVKGDLLGIARAHRLSEKVMSNIKQNLFFAFVYNVLGVPIAAGLLYPAFGILLSPMIAAVAMSFSSVSVILNSLRLRGAKI